VAGRHRPGESPADVVADDHRVGLAEGRDERGHVGGQRGRVVAARRLVAAAVPAQVDRHGPVTGIGQVDQLLVPAPPELGKTVQQQDERPGAELGDVQGDAIGPHDPMRPWSVDHDDRAVGRARQRPETHPG
jgi:hypothetical protein